MHEAIKRAYSIATIIILPLIGFGGVYALLILLPIKHSVTNQSIFIVAMIAVGLIVPYWMLKLGLHEAHRHNAKERELELKNLPKDKEQLAEDNK